MLTALNKDDDIKEYNTSSLGGELSVGYDENFQTAISESSVVLTTDAVFDSQRLVDIALDVKLKAISDVLGERLNLFYRDGEIDQYIYIGFGA